MIVAELLKAKGTQVVTTGPEKTIATTARLLTSKKIGAVVVKDARGRIIGIISERDIVRGVAKDGEKALEMKVADLMTSDLVSCKQEDDLMEVMALMTNRRVRHLPVVEDDKLKGILSIRDVIKIRLEESQTEVDVLRDYVLRHPLKTETREPS